MFKNVIKAVKDLGMFKSLKHITDDHGSELLSICSIGLRALSLYSAFHSSEKVTEIKKQYDRDVKDFEDRISNEKIITEKEYKETIRDLKINRDIHYARTYKWALACAAGSVVCDIASNKINSTKISNLTIALAASEDKIRKLMKKTKETIDNSEDFQKFKEEFRNDVIEEKVKQGDAPFELPCTGEGDVFFDSYICSLFEIPEQQVLDGIDLANDYMSRNPDLNFNKWRGFIGLPDCPAGACVEWNSLNPFDAKIVDEYVHGRLVKVIEYENMPCPHIRKQSKKR